MERVLRDLRMVVLPCRGCIHLTRVFPAQRLVRPVVVVTLDKCIEPALLLQVAVAGRLGRFLLEGQMHPLMATVPLGMARLDAFDRDTEPQPPDREPAQTEQGVRR